MVRSVLLVSALLLVAVAEAKADPILYSNGAISGTGYNVYPIGDGNSVSDSFTLANASNLTGVQLGLWAFYAEPPATVQWSIGTTPFGSGQGSGTANLANTLYKTSTSGLPVYSSTFPINLQLGSGTYWLTLQNGTDSGGNTLGWDANYGPSSAFLYSTAYPNPSESFQILGTVATATPEPASINLLGIGIAGLAGYGWRSRAKSRSKIAVV
jgi:hypothetical protein